MRSGLLALVLLSSLAVAAPAAPQTKDGKNRRITVENLSSRPIHHLYASPITSTTWEEDLLGEGTIPAGSSKAANIDNGTTECSYDLRVVLSDSKEYVRRKVNVCAVSKWVIGDSGDSIQ